MLLQRALGVVAAGGTGGAVMVCRWLQVALQVVLQVQVQVQARQMVRRWHCTTALQA